MSAWSIVVLVAEWLIFIYALTISAFYLVLAVFSIWAIRGHMKKNYFVDHRELLGSPLVPSISLIAPAYNESLTIIDNVKSLLAIQYSNFEVLIVNDGSKDDSMEKMIQAFNLVKVPFHVVEKVKTKPVRGIYKSTNRAFKRLTIIDKENGGKADALNVGLNVSDKRLVACIDVDCIIEPDALLKMVKPFMEETDHVIASGGVVRIANSCEVEEGRLVKVNLPENRLARFQVLEYLRAFLLGRMAWSKMDGLLLISGAFGMFDREIALAAGGYYTKTVGEDMELVVRMRTYMVRHKRPYKVTYIPDPLCWTEAPANNAILSRQRNRWARGTFEVLKLHRYLFFNPTYKVMGLISYPFWFFFEWMAPFVEMLGLLYFLFLWIFGSIWWLNFLGLLTMVFCFAIFISTFALMAEEFSYFKYTSRKDTWKMLLTILLEPFIYHPKTTFWSLKGNFDLIKGKHTWGEMTREGFKKKPFIQSK